MGNGGRVYLEILTLFSFFIWWQTQVGTAAGPTGPQQVKDGHCGELGATHAIKACLL